ncbi:metallo-mystery pair system four-Cys motif protein [Leptospira sp. 2 VSF19]|uniref:Metallo-mystery pair system four-Cys motif protein n=1 Tax=Leptospira soteropolitanensis TaxID=2950025 RepID=A0AAW5VAD7_9LEPT|nr:MbnP family copper-binding protein [Leptospira soteropolitanensis]MCW7491208.1 metallo-mystery pair system four-Cys motif protein [Leptospira soteropolitanensis]MCW7498792.1 metallo-mystery pair system four-Cys motif protein [Leptospira soteropolitanensis]MCW7521615.1 metallo-mystery pair system four-Cys motif protein [Leptospira soteropolitanensis]MCW7524896.1 metallo-mystery pair system four-Cys motif protein [Leptospira soteropolitanensis]MCW7528763.1 metallo-mystery pair system four-Cys
MNIFIKIIFSISVIGLASCTPKSKSDDTETLTLLALAWPQPVNLEFEALANGQKLVTGSNFTSADARTVQFRDFRLYISEVKLIRADGSTADVSLSADNVWQSNGVALVDLETTQTQETNTKVSGGVAPGTYTGVQFSVGVPEALNHLDKNVQLAPLNIGSMYWSWTGGYKHANIEFSVNAGTNFTKLHLGSTGCTGAPNYGNCTAKYRASIQLTGQYNPVGQKISFDVDKLIQGHTPGAANASCMPVPMNGDDPAPCYPLIQAFGLSNGGAVDKSITQRVFSLK